MAKEDANYEFGLHVGLVSCRYTQPFGYTYRTEVYREVYCFFLVLGAFGLVI